MRDWIATIGAVVVLLCIGAATGTYLVSAYQTASLQRPDRPKQVSPEYAAKTNPNQAIPQSSPVLIQIIPTPKSDEEAARDAKEREEKSQTDIWLVRFTGLLFFVGAVQTIAFFMQARRLRQTVEAAKAATDLANSEFQAAHRPQLVIHSVRLLVFKSSTPPDQQPICAEFAIVNAGTGACWVTGSAVYLEYLEPIDRPHIPSMNRNDVIPVAHLCVGATNTQIRIESDEHGGLIHVAAIDEAAFIRGFNELGDANVPRPKKTLYLSGWVVYAGMGGNDRTTYFRRLYSHDTERFSRGEDPDDEQTY